MDIIKRYKLSIAASVLYWRQNVTLELPNIATGFQFINTLLIK